MKKLYIASLLMLSTSWSSAQIGAVAPDFTVTDISGNSHNLYTYLNAGKVVILDISATWCGPCWNFHNGHFLESLYDEFGPNGTDEVVVLFYEADGSTNSADLHGTGSSTQGDWVTGVPYPIIDEAQPSLNQNIFAPLGYPTINVICPSDKKIKADLWDSGGNLNHMRGVVQTNIDNCALAAGVQEQLLLNAVISPNPTGSKTTINLTSPNAGEATVSIYSVSGALISEATYSVENGQNAIELDLSALDSGTYFVSVKTDELASGMLPVVKQ